MTQSFRAGVQQRAFLSNDAEQRSGDIPSRQALLGAALLRALPLLALLGVSGCGGINDRAANATPDPALRLSSVLLSSGAAEAALRVADEVLGRQPRSVAAYEARGAALAALGRVDEAQQSYTTAIAINPSAIAPRIALGRMLIRTNPPAAEAVFAEVLARQPRNAVALNNLGVARDLQGRHAEAQPAYRAAMAADAAMTGAGVNLGLSLVLSGNMPEAVRTLRPLAAGPGASETVTENLAIALTANGETAEAERLLARSMPPAEIGSAMAAYRQIAATPLDPQPIAAPPTAFSGAAEPAAVKPAGQPASLSGIGMPAARREVIAAPATLEPSDQAQPVAGAAVSPVIVPAVVDPSTASVAVPASAAAILPLPVAMPVAAVIAPPEPAARPEPAAQPVAPRIVPVSPPRAPAGASATHAQLVMAASAERALATWEALRGKLGQALDDQQPLVVPGNFRGQAVWSLRTGPFTAPRSAETFCQQVRAVGQDCWAMTPGAMTPDAMTPGAMTLGTMTPGAAGKATPGPAQVEPVWEGARSPALGSRAAFAQLAVAESAAGAEFEWQKLRHRLGGLLGDRDQITVTAERAGGTFWRLRTGPFQAAGDAEAFCVEVRAAGGGCWAATTPHGC